MSLKAISWQYRFGHLVAVQCATETFLLSHYSKKLDEFIYLSKDSENICQTSITDPKTSMHKFSQIYR